MTQPPTGVYFWKAAPPENRKPVLAAATKAFPLAFPKPGDALDFLSRIFVPASKRWAFLSNGKSGTSSTQHFLFQLEFGVPLTVALDHPDDVNPDAAVHRLHQANVLRKVIDLPQGIAVLPDLLRLVTVRHPGDRALSAFFYLCATHDRAHPWMAEDRMRMNAMVQFNWNSDTRTASGYQKFLRYIDISQHHPGNLRVNPHWRPQILNICPDVYRPDLIGRTENLAAFFHAIADRLGQPLAPGWQAPRANSQEKPDLSPFRTPATHDLLRRIYAADFAQFGYDPDTQTHPT